MAGNDTAQSDFSIWLRTWRRPCRPSPDDVEVKFNPWHDPANGQFTFAGSGRYYGRGGQASTGASASDPTRKRPTTPPADASGRRPSERGVSGLRDRAGRTPAAPDESRVAAFASGLGEGVRAAATDVAGDAYATLTTNPLTTLRATGRGLAGLIDGAMTAENAPARVQARRFADTVAKATPREIGHAIGATGVHAAVAGAPAGALARMAAVRQMRRAALTPNYEPVRIGWVKETQNSEHQWKKYNDEATGARPGQAPVIFRTMPDGKHRPVKFDGIQGEYLIDRKWSVFGKPRAVAQLLRQEQALRENGLIATWEVRNEIHRQKALRLFKKHDIISIKVRIVKP